MRAAERLAYDLSELRESQRRDRDRIERVTRALEDILAEDARLRTALEDIAAHQWSLRSTRTIAQRALSGLEWSDVYERPKQLTAGVS